MNLDKLPPKYPNTFLIYHLYFQSFPSISLLDTIIFKDLPSTYLPHRQEIERLSAAELGKAAKVSLAEGDLTEERWTRYSARASQLVAEVNFPEAAGGVKQRDGRWLFGWLKM